MTACVNKEAVQNLAANRAAIANKPLTNRKKTFRPPAKAFLPNAQITLDAQIEL